MFVIYCEYVISKPICVKRCGTGFERAIPVKRRRVWASRECASKLSVYCSLPLRFTWNMFYREGPSRRPRSERRVARGSDQTMEEPPAELAGRLDTRPSSGRQAGREHLP